MSNYFLQTLSQSFMENKLESQFAPTGSWKEVAKYTITSPEFYEGLEFVSDNKLLRSSGLNG